jgi:hypothetical protein
MSTLSEQDRPTPRDPLYYAPRWLRDRPMEQPAAFRDASPDTPFSPASFDARLEGAVSDALRHPLDPEVMREPYADGIEPRGALWSITARFAAAVGVSALVALFFVVVVPVSRQGDNAASALSGIAHSIKTALSPSEQKDVSQPAVDEFQSILASAQAHDTAKPGQSGELLKQFMQWQQKPDSAAP